MTTLSHDELEQMYAIFVFSNTPAYLYKHTRQLLVSRPGIKDATLKDVEAILEKAQGDEALFFSRLALCLASLVNVAAVEALRDTSTDDLWWGRLLSMAHNDASKKDFNLANQNIITQFATILPSGASFNKTIILER